MKGRRKSWPAVKVPIRKIRKEYENDALIRIS